MAETPPLLDWHERKDPREWSAVVEDPTGTLVAVIHYTRCAPVALVELNGTGLGGLTVRATLYRRIPGGWGLLREAYADTVREAKLLAHDWIDRLTQRGPA